MHPIAPYLKNLPRNYRDCEHNAMQAFPQEKISHYTIGISNETPIINDTSSDS